MVTLTPIHATPLEALPNSWALFSNEDQCSVLGKTRDFILSGEERPKALTRAVLECSPDTARAHARRIATDVAGYSAALDNDDVEALSMRAAVATAKASEASPPTYRSEQAADGTWTIYHVPIFSEHEDDRGRKKRVFGKAWLEGALERAMVRQAEGYFAPLHVRHHDMSSGQDANVEAAGKIRFSSLEQLQLGGVPTWTLFADLVGVHPAVYDRIRRGELSYRSIEIIDVRKGEIDSLALLDHEVPFFRFPLLRIAEETPRSMRLERGAAPALAYRAGSDHGIAVLFRYSAGAAPGKDSPMIDPKAKEKDPKDEEGKSETRVEGEGGDPQLGQVLSGIMGILKQIASKLGVGAEGDEEAPPPQMSAGPVDVGMPGASMNSAGGDQDDAVSALFGQFTASAIGTQTEITPQAVTHQTQGALLALNGRLETVQRNLAAMQVENRLVKKAAELREHGFTEAMVDEFMKRANSDGEPAALAFAAGMASVGAIEPPPTWAGDMASQPADPPEVAELGKQGPEVLAQARRIYKSWKRLGSQHSLKDYLEVNLDPNSYLANAAGR